MAIILIMAAGVLVGARWFPARLQKLNSWMQLVCTAVLIYAMGVSLGNRPDFFEELSSLGWASLLLALLPIFFSMVFVFILSRLLLEKPRKKSGGNEE